MAKASTITISAFVSGDGIVGSTYNPPMSPLPNANAPGGIPVEYQLSAGSNSIVAPPGTLRALVVPVLNAVNAKNAKTTSGDVGIVFTADPVLIPIAGGATLYINSVGADTVFIVWG